MDRNNLIQTALNSAWHKQTAEASLDRWLQICDQEKWGEIPENIGALIAIFGASWYFTRFIFYRGRKSAQLIDTPDLEKFDEETLSRFLSQATQAEDQEHQFEWLRSLKNQAMLQILLRRLSAQDNLDENESNLTRLATATLTVAMQIAGLDLQRADCQIAVLGMGRIAGYEMNYGSDLDLIFLYEDSTEEFRTFFSDKVRYLLRNMSLLSASGVLYDIDMRLRPHGTSGSLVTSVNSFQAYHQGKREIWERQMMTRCRPIVDHHDQGQHAMQQIRKQIYRESYDSTLSMEILLMRKRVEDELGSRKGKYDIKRGRGGIMDIDFLTHFLQLKHGYECPDLQIMSTREVLKLLAVHKFVSTEDATQLLIAYDFFKNIEACLRLFDLKSVNSFAKILNDGNALVRAMNYQSTDAATRFIIDYREKSDFVHKMFVDTLNEIDN